MNQRLVDYAKISNSEIFIQKAVLELCLRDALRSKIPQFNDSTTIFEWHSDTAEIGNIGELIDAWEPLYRYKKEIVTAGVYRHSLNLPLVSSPTRKKEVVSIEKNKLSAMPVNFTLKRVRLRHMHFAVCGINLLLKCGYDAENDTLYVRPGG